MKDCSSIFSLGWKLMMSLGQDEPIQTYINPYRRHFAREVCYGGRVGNIPEFEKTAITPILIVIRYHLYSNTGYICNLIARI